LVARLLKEQGNRSTPPLLAALRDGRAPNRRCRSTWRTEQEHAADNVAFGIGHARRAMPARVSRDGRLSWLLRRKSLQRSIEAMSPAHTQLQQISCGVGKGNMRKERIYER
jgi:hypothetical protein